MIQKYRNQFNQNFTEEKYKKFIKALEKNYKPIPFRVAETPIFIPQELKKKLIAAGKKLLH